jgi:ribose/xylose/arabinose/galactoside ABC-type transport system permease subunit
MNKILGILLLLVFVCVGTTLLTDAFVKPFNVQNIVRNCALYGIIGVGVSMVIITGGIDLSIGSVIGLVGCVLPSLLIDRGWTVSAALAAVMLLSLLIGLTHGLLITRLRLQPFIVTLCGLLIYRGVARWLTSDQTKGFGSTYDESLRLLAIGKPCSVALLVALAGVGLTLWSLVRGWRGLRQRAELPGACVGLLLGGALIAIGSSRYWSGYRIDSGAELFRMGGMAIRSWRVTVAELGVGRPQELMSLAGWGVVPGGVWLAAVLLRRAGARVVVPVAMVLLTGGLVWLARQMAMQPDDWFWPGPDWARTWRILGVFGSLGALMWALSDGARQATQLAGAAAVPPLLLTGSSSALWLVGKTPLGETLVPAPLLLLLALSGAAWVFLDGTIYGRYLLALGHNEEAARFSGINTDRMTVLAYVLCSLSAGLGGILFALDTNSIQPASHGSFYELYAIAAAVLGGCSLRGGEGNVLGVVIGAAVVRVLYNSINLIGIPSQLEFAIIGSVILLGVLTDELMKRMAARRAVDEAA